MSGVRGLHHVTAITGDAAGNAAFWTRTLGLRLVKRTVNFDAPTVWHLYYGDEVGRPGTAMTFFVFPGAAEGRPGRGTTAVTQFSIPPGSLDFWRERLEGAGLAAHRETAFGEERLLARGPEGLMLALTVPADEDARPGWTGGGIGAEHAIRGFRGVTLALDRFEPTAAILTGLFGYAEAAREETDGATRIRYRAAEGPADVVDIEVRPGEPRAREGAGSVHHVAFAVPDDAAELEVRRRLLDAGLQVTPQIDRFYFHSIYFRTPGGVLFEVATEAPGFTVDEPAESLGSTLMIPAQHRHMRAEIEAALPDLGL